MHFWNKWSFQVCDLTLWIHFRCVNTLFCNWFARSFIRLFCFLVSLLLTRHFLFSLSTSRLFYSKNLNDSHSFTCYILTPFWAVWIHSIVIIIFFLLHQKYKLLKYLFIKMLCARMCDSLPSQNKILCVIHMYRYSMIFGIIWKTQFSLFNNERWNFYVRCTCQLFCSCLYNCISGLNNLTLMPQEKRRVFFFFGVFISYLRCSPAKTQQFQCEK